LLMVAEVEKGYQAFSYNLQIKTAICQEEWP
jgi:hypothetical protein